MVGLGISEPSTVGVCGAWRFLVTEEFTRGSSAKTDSDGGDGRMSLHELPWLFVDFHSFHISIISPCRTSQHSRGSMNIHQKAAPNSSNPSSCFKSHSETCQESELDRSASKSDVLGGALVLYSIYIYDYIEVEDETAKWLPKKHEPRVWFWIYLSVLSI